MKYIVMILVAVFVMGVIAYLYLKKELPPIDNKKDVAFPVKEWWVGSSDYLNQKPGYWSLMPTSKTQIPIYAIGTEVHLDTTGVDFPALKGHITSYSADGRILNLDVKYPTTGRADTVYPVTATLYATV